MRRFAFAAALSALALAACGADEAVESTNPPLATVDIASSERAVTASGLDALRNGITPAGMPEPAVDLADIRSGGPPPDGIPPVDDPKYVSPSAVELAATAPVLALEINGDARAYPVEIMTWHEIVNDTVGGVPVSVTYCPLCNSAIAYDRRLPAAAHDTVQVVDFGTSGMLLNSSLVMYDRQTETLWSHFSGAGIVGELTGVELTTIPVQTVAWEVWRDANPDGQVLSRDTGFDREYGRNPYPGYDDIDASPFLFEGNVDGRFTAMTRVVGAEVDGTPVAVSLAALESDRVVALDGATLWWQPGTTSALDATTIDEGRDIGQTGMFASDVDGQTLSFSSGDDGVFVDDQTASTWNIFGTATDGELAGTQLEPIAHVDTFWFAWAAFEPETETVGG